MFEMHGHTLTSDVHDQNMHESSVNVISFHDLCETWNPWITLFSIYRDFEWITCEFMHNFISFEIAEIT